MSFRVSIIVGFILVFGTACPPLPDSGSGATTTTTSGLASPGDLPPPDDAPAPTTAIEPTTTTTTTTTTTATETSTTDETTTGAEPMCGDGHLDPGEDCDLGPDNANDGACTLRCDSATCGDGLLWIGHEECDFGAGNTGEHGGCNPDCTLAPYCGDGLVDDLNEECDFGPLNGTGVGLEDKAPCAAACQWQGRLVFLSSELYSGNLGGLSGADLKCRNLALAAGLINPLAFRAWLSDGVDSPAASFWQPDFEAPFVLRNGRIIAADLAELVEQGPRTGITVTETGEHLFKQRVWTNTSPLGAPFSAVDHCDGWSSSSGMFVARVGYNAIELEQGPEWQTWHDERHWTSVTNSSCDYPRRLYCFEDGYSEQ